MKIPAPSKPKPGTRTLGKGNTGLLAEREQARREHLRSLAPYSGPPQGTPGIRPRSAAVERLIRKP
jgi:hypothetical protein